MFHFASHTKLPEGRWKASLNSPTKKSFANLHLRVSSHLRSRAASPSTQTLGPLRSGAPRTLGEAEDFSQKTVRFLVVVSPITLLWVLLFLAKISMFSGHLSSQIHLANSAEFRPHTKSALSKAAAAQRRSPKTTLESPEKLGRQWK